MDRRSSKVHPLPSPIVIHVAESPDARRLSLVSSVLEQCRAQPSQISLSRSSRAMYSMRRMMCILIKWLKYLYLQITQELGVRFSHPKSEKLFQMYSFRWKAPVMVSTSVYAIIIFLFFIATSAYRVSIEQSGFSSSIFADCNNNGECRFFASITGLSCSVIILLLVFIGVVIRSQRQNCFLKILVAFVFILTTVTILGTLVQQHLDYITFIHLTVWLGIVVYFMPERWIFVVFVFIPFNIVSISNNEPDYFLTERVSYCIRIHVHSYSEKVPNEVHIDSKYLTLINLCTINTCVINFIHYYHCRLSFSFSLLLLTR